MVNFNSQTLANGLQVLVHEDKNTNIVALNIAYKVGSRDEQEKHTGFAHLFEHLMFGGSVNIPSYDEPLQKAGGENNAYTTPDLTNYYLTVPANNIETGFWLESDRMLSLSFDPKVLEVQRKVVIEEFNQRYLNQPYGDVWHKMREMAYKVHPYKWPTIGKNISHIETATMEQVKAFFKKYYVPNNAVLVIAGNIETSKAFSLAEKWFGPIPRGKEIIRNIAKEPKQIEKRVLNVHAQVPANAYYKAFHMPERTSSNYHIVDLLSDVLGRGKSSRLNQKLVETDRTFSEISAYVTGSFDPGLLVISGKLTDGTNFSDADKGVNHIINELLNSGIEDRELEKVKNQAIASLAFGEVQVLNRAMNLAYYALLGDANLVNTEEEKLDAITSEQVLNQGRELLVEDNSSTMYYHANTEK
ncbi:MAG: insulinase family protein [Bacteroidetes bacterium]|nr:MAG: insulinase family protein [Bacteroidota bacterium]